MFLKPASSLRHGSLKSIFALLALAACATPSSPPVGSPLKAPVQATQPSGQQSATTPAAPGAVAVPVATVDSSSRVVVLYMSDLHGRLRSERLASGALAGGYARLASLIARERQAAAPKTDVWVIVGGDIAGKSAIPCRKTGEKECFPLLKEMGVDVAVLGNGELKRSAAELNELIKASQIPWVGTNVRARGVSGAWTSAVQLVGARSGAKMWVSGWTVAPSPGEVDLKKAKLEVTATPAARDFEVLKKRFANAPVLWATHQELAQDMSFLGQACQTQGLASLVLLKANDHEQKEDRTQCAPIFEPGAFGETVSRLVFEPASDVPGGWKLGSHEFIAVDEKIAEDPALKSHIDALYAQYAPDADQVVAHAAQPKTEQEFSEWAASAFRKATKTDIAIVNSGAVKSGVPAGDLTKEQLAMVYPYTDELMGADVSLRDFERSLCTASQRSKVDFEDYGSELTLDGARLVDAGKTSCHLEGVKKPQVKISMVSFLVRRSSRWLGKELSSVAFKYGFTSDRAFEMALKNSGQKL